MGKLLAIFALTLCIALSSCSVDPIEKLIPQSATVGALQNFTVTDIIVQDGKSINGGVYIQGTVQTPYDIKKEQLKPTLLAAIKKLKYENKRCEWIRVFAGVGHGKDAGRAEYTRGKIEINYDIPTEQQLKDFNAERIKDGEDTLRMPTKEEFDLAISIDTVRQKIYSKILDQELEETLDPQKRKSKKTKLTRSENFDDIIIGMTAKEMNLPKEKARQTRNLLWYYSFPWGSEIIKSE